MKRVVFAIVSVLLGGFSMLVAATPASAEDLIVLSSGSSAVLPATPTADAVFPMTPVGATSAEGLQASVVRVVRDNRPTSAEQSAAVVASVVTDIPAIKLTANVDALSQVGTYRITVAVISGALRQLVDLELVRSSAAIQAPATVQVQRTVLVPEFNWCLAFCSEELPELRLVAGADSRVTQLNAYGTGASADQVVMGSYDQAMPVALPTPLTEGGSLVLPYILTGPAQLGSVQRPVTINSPQLSQPLPVQFDVVTKRSAVLIVVIAALGMLLGFFVRRGLVTVRDRAAAVSRALDLADRLETLRAAKADEAFRKTTDQLIGRLRAVSRWRPVTEVDGVVNDSEVAANAALADLRTRLVAVATELPGYEAMLGRDWQVPSVLKGRLAQATGSLTEASKRFDLDDAAGAQAELGTLQSLLTSSVRPEAESVVETAVANAGALTEVLSRHSNRRGVQQLLVRPQRIAQLPPLAADAPLMSVLLAAHQVTLDSKLTVDEIASWLAASLTGPDPDERTRVVQQVQGLATQDFPLAMVGGILDDVLPAADSEVDELLESAGVPEGDRNAETPNEVATPLDPDLFAPSHRSVRAEQISARRRQALAGVVRIGAQIVRFALLLAVLSLAAYGLFGPSWTGTYADMLAVFSWAFAIDVGIDAVATTLRPGTAAPTT